MGCLDKTRTEFISPCKELGFCPPYLWDKIDRHEPLLVYRMCRGHLTSGDLPCTLSHIKTYINTICPRYHSSNVLLAELTPREMYLLFLIKIQSSFSFSPPTTFTTHHVCDVIMQQIRHRLLCDGMHVILSNRCALARVMFAAATRDRQIWKIFFQRLKYKMWKSNKHF